VFGWLRRRRLSEKTRRKLLVALARADEALIETHVQNALDVIKAVGDEVPLERALDLYLDALEPNETRAAIVARRVLARIESGDAAPARSRPVRPLRRILEE